MTLGRGARYGALAIILLVALAWRLHNIGFGLPSLYDPDEPIFMIKALELLTNGTLNPKWFGHPGSTTIYLLALIDAAVVGSELASGAYASVDAFAKAAFENPGLLFIPARTAMALLGVLAVWMTYLVGRRTHGTSVALIAAALLAFNSVHIAWSQVVRTDIHASVFMLASLLFAIRIGQHGRITDYILAGLFAGFAVATKWPAVTIFIAVLGATASRVMKSRSELKRDLLGVIVAGIAVLVGVFVASPSSSWTGKPFSRTCPTKRDPATLATPARASCRTAGGISGTRCVNPSASWACCSFWSGLLFRASDRECRVGRWSRPPSPSLHSLQRRT